MFKIIVSLNAQEDLEKIDCFYSKISEVIASKFVNNLYKTYSLLEINPFFAIRYKNYRAVSIDKFPYLLFFEIDEINKIIFVLTCFNTKQNPKKFPK